MATRAWHTQQTAIPPQPQLATLAGQARDVAADQPLSGVTISVTLGADTYTATTDSQGRYLINDLAPGTASLSASLPNYHSATATGVLSAGQVLTFSPNMAPQPLPQPITISGQVIDGDTSAAISGATIRVLNSSYATQSGANGDFSLTGIAAGTATVEISQAGYIPTTYSISSPAGGALNLGVILLAPGVANGTTGTVTGLMTDAITGSALRGVQVTVSGADNRTAYTDTDGRFTLTDINPGNIFLTASLTGYRNATSSANLSAGSTLQFNGALVKEENAALVTLFGSVIDASTQQPLTGVAVNIGSSHTTQTGPQGEFYVSGVEPGSFDVVYTLAGYNPVVLTVNATAGSVVDLSGIVLVSDLPVSGNQAPVITSTGPANAAVGQVYEYRVSATDPDGDALSFGLSAYPAGMEIDASTGVIRWIPTINQSGQQLFTLVVSDTGGAIAVENVTVSVTQGVDQTYVITDVETLNGLTQDALIPSNYILGSYVTGGRSGTWTASSPLGCGFSYTTTGSDPASIQQAGDALDFWSMGSGYGSDAIWDMGMGFSSVSVLPLIDHEPFPQEGIEYTIWGSNDPNATFPDGWELATLVTIYSQGWADNRAQCTESVNIDDYAGLYTFGETEYQYIRLKADNSISIFDTPEHTTWSTNIDDSGLPGWQSVESEIDGVAGMVCDVKPLANAGEDMLGMTGETIQFDASSSQGTILTYGWDLDGDSEIDLTGATPSHIFNAGFDRVVSLLVVDDRGCVGSDTVHVTVGLEYPRPDLIVSEIDTGGIATNLQTLSIAGSVSVEITNSGRAAAVDAAVVTLYEDSNANGVFESGIDNQLGTQTMPRGLARNESLSVEMAVNGTVSFRDVPIYAMVDSDSRIDESNETNNTNTSANQCRVIPDSTAFEPVLKWSWSGSSIQPSYNQVMMAPVVVPLEDTNNDGLFDENDTPSIVFSTAYPLNNYRSGYLRAISGLDGRELWTASRLIHRAGSLAAGDIDGDGAIEIIAVRPGSTITTLQSTGLIAFEHTGEVKWENTDTAGVNWGSASIADIDGDGVPEIIGGNTVLNADGSLRWKGVGYSGVKTPHEGQLSIVADINLDGEQEVVAGAAAYASDGTRLWQNTGVGDGYDGVGNFDADDYAEIVVVANSRVALLEHTGEVIWGPVALPGGGDGGAPTIADVDGDGAPEIGVAGASFYTVFDTDGTILWSASIRDNTSHVTGSSVFDFDGDGKVEVVYSDELYLRVYNGSDGVVLFETPNNSVTTFELPVIVDIDNDDHAEIVVCSNNYYFAGSTGIQVYEDINDAWEDTRSIWNQHAYHITNVNDDGSIPANEQPSWLTHNSYRLNTFADPVVTLFPDITASKLQILDNGAAQPAAISVRIGNGGAGDLTREIAIAFYEGDPASGGTLLGTVSLSGLTAGSYQDLTLNDVTILSGTADIYVIADYDNRVQECNEANNQVVLPVLPQTSNGAIGVATDVAVFGPDSPVQLMAVVTNTSAIPGEFRAELRVEDTQGTLIQSYPPRAVGPMAGGAAINLNDVWNTASYQAGAYRLHGLLTDLDGVLVDEAQSPFEIRHSVDNLPLATLRTTTDQPIYHTSDTAQLNNLARNLSGNTQIRDAGLRIRVTNATGDDLFTHSQTLGELPSSAFRDTITPYSFTNAAEGIYTVTGELTDASGNLLATGQAQFEIVADLQKDLTGTVTAQLKIVQRGQPQTCTDALTYTDSQALNGQPLRQILVNLDSAETVTSSDTTINLEPGATESLIRSVATDNLNEGIYSCVLQAMITGEWVTLGHDTFSLTVPTIAIDGTLEQATLPRLLVLLDENKPCTDDDDSNGGDDSDHDCCTNSSDSDPHGPSNAPLLSEQRSYLEALLDSQGYSYTIVSDSAAFAQQLLSGAYNTYALFSEHVKLTETIQKALREAIYRGEGLLVAGDHDHRNHNLYDALGINYRGKKPNANAVEMSDSDLSGPQELALQLEERVINAELSNATSAGHFLFSGNHTDIVHAVAVNSYGEGHAVHVSYDLLAEAALAGLSSPHTELIRSALATIAPVFDLPRLGGSVPILLTVTNQGMATPGQAVITLPQGVALIDSGGAIPQPNGSIVWPFNLQQSESSALMLWLQPQSDQSDLRIDALIQTGEAPDLFDQATLSLTLILSSAPTLSDLLSELSLLVDQDNAYRKAFNLLEKAQQALDQSDSDDAFEKMLKGSEALIKLDTPEAGQIRLKLAEVIRLAGLTQTTDREHHDSDDDSERCHENSYI
ncbi:MAG: carboxypeptidase regulatory-like domain-containing protein [Candidatus Thiodiazotropha sp. (ex Lucinoma kastoroae)]|nr:carboxypeptidase regulatory-like domain-containing protein [Candidatus Thiodiazotropha sp. (ex Lucinoma kastoroae)]